MPRNDEDWADFCDDMDRQDELEFCIEFANPGSALRTATKDDPRIHPCPTCGEPNRLTRRDRNLGYQCDDCADASERGY